MPTIPPWRARTTRIPPVTIRRGSSLADALALRRAGFPPEVVVLMLTSDERPVF